MHLLGVGCVTRCSLLGTLLDDVLKSEVGTELFNKVERIRSLAQCAAQLANKHDSVSHTCFPQQPSPSQQLLGTSKPASESPSWQLPW